MTMASIFLNCSSFAPLKLERVGRSFFPTRRRESSVCCRGGVKANYNASDFTSPTDLVDKARLVIEKSQAHDNNIDNGIGIAKFHRGKVILVTGGTGFLAKVLVEKILRTMPDVGKIYLLIRAKNKEAAMGRLKNEIINCELFKGLQQSYGKSYQAFMSSILVPVVGNISDSDLGIENDLADTIAEEVDVIVNSSANTTFNERYDVSLSINIKGPCHLMSFAKTCKKLKLFLHVSTAYVNGRRQGNILERQFRLGESIAGVDARGFPLILDIENEMKLISSASMEDLDNKVMSQKMRALGLQRAQQHGWQDTYVFSKAMGEMMIDNMRGDVPLVIMRPSVIESTFKDPFPDWIEGNRMLDPLILGYGKGQLRGFPMDPNAAIDVIPVDMVVNATLSAIAKHGLDQSPDTNIYQVASSAVNPLVFGDLFALTHQHFNSLPFVDSKGEPVHMASWKFFSSMDEFSEHLGADSCQRKGLADLVESSGTRLTQKLAETAKNLASIYENYTFYNGRFDHSNTEKLMESMCEEEKSKFGFDVENIEWKDYIKDVHIPGLRKHVLKGRG